MSAAVSLLLHYVAPFILPMPPRGLDRGLTTARTGRKEWGLAFPPPSTRSWGGKVVVFMGRRAAKIANRKGKADAARTKVYAAFGKKIIMAVKAGGADPETNRALAVLMKEAKAAGVPGENVARAIARGSNANEADFKDATYEVSR